MRKLALVLALIGLLAVPVFAQFGPRGGGPELLLLNKSVQDELKLSADQKTGLKKIQDKVTEEGKKAREEFMAGEFEKGREILEKANKVAAKELGKFKETLSATQSKRIKQIELQFETRTNSIKVFAREDVAKALKLTPKQKERLAEAVKDLDSDIKEIMSDVRKGDFKSFFAANKKADSLRQKALAAFEKGLTADQKTAWKEMTGEPFEIVFPKFKGKGKGKRDDI
jgi:hypothetical protein